VPVSWLFAHRLAPYEFDTIEKPLYQRAEALCRAAMRNPKRHSTANSARFLMPVGARFEHAPVSDLICSSCNTVGGRLRLATLSRGMGLVSYVRLPDVHASRQHLCGI
jgi:hypothetical protein